MNPADIVIIIAIIAISAGIVARQILRRRRLKKSGQPTCGCSGCDSCPSHGDCCK